MVVVPQLLLVVDGELLLQAVQLRRLLGSSACLVLLLQVLDPGELDRQRCR